MSQKTSLWDDCFLICAKIAVIHNLIQYVESLVI